MKHDQILDFDKSNLPTSIGYLESATTLCIGLDVAWFGGSRNDPSSRYDFLAAAVIDSQLTIHDVDCVRIPLKNHDLDGTQTATGLKSLIERYRSRKVRVVLAVDAPLQAVTRGLPTRQPIPEKGQVKRRACEDYLNCKRKGIDTAFGGAKGWHPNIQPGAPIAPRIQCLLNQLADEFELWTPEKAQQENIVIECFPAEAIWAAKRMNWFRTNVTATEAKAYKSKKSKKLIATEVVELAEAVLVPFGHLCPNLQWKNQVVDKVLAQILEDRDCLWKRDGQYPGGKLLDDVIDSLICLATAIGYAANKAHVWQDQNYVDDGHIIGPGTMQEIVAPQLGSI